MVRPIPWHPPNEIVQILFYLISLFNLKVEKLIYCDHNFNLPIGSAVSFVCFLSVTGGSPGIERLRYFLVPHSSFFTCFSSPPFQCFHCKICPTPVHRTFCDASLLHPISSPDSLSFASVKQKQSTPHQQHFVPYTHPLVTKVLFTEITRNGLRLAANLISPQSKRV